MNNLITTGRRKNAVARANAKKGNGTIKINKKPLELYEPRYLKLRIQEPTILASDKLQNMDIEVNVKGGGISGQADACRVAIANALVKNDEELKKKLLDYDRTLLVSDPRRKEKHKPSRSSKGARRTKQQSKR